MNIENAFSVTRSSEIELGSLCLFKPSSEYFLGLAITTSRSSDKEHQIYFLRLTNVKDAQATIFHYMDLAELNVIDLGKNYQIFTSTNGGDYSNDEFRTAISLFGMANDGNPRQKRLFLRHPGFDASPLFIDISTGYAVSGSLTKRTYCHSWKIVDQNNEVIFEMTNNQ